MLNPIKNTKKPHPCYYCAETVPIKSKAYSEKFLNNLVWQTAYVCVECGIKKGAKSF
jgi:hypothetical protein